MTDGATPPPDRGPSEAHHSVASPKNSNLQSVAATSASWNCQCAHACNPAQAAHCLYLHAMDVLSDTRNSTGSDAVQRLIGPLITLVGRQKTREGHAECNAFVRALMDEDEGSAILACRRLIDLAGELGLGQKAGGAG
ncbi:MAG: hypothetical protein RLY97_200 [Pseudomonadota bacterium]|jgi:hypothetical protein